MHYCICRKITWKSLTILTVFNSVKCTDISTTWEGRELHPMPKKYAKILETKLISRKNMSDRKLLKFPHCDGGQSQMRRRHVMMQRISRERYPTTVWKCQDFAITQILSEINFGDYGIGSAKTAVLTHLKALNFANLVKCSLQEV